MRVLPIDRVMSWWRNGNGEQRVSSPPRQGPSLPQAETGGLPPEIKSPPERAPWKEQWDHFGVPHTLNYPSTTLGRMLDQTADRFGDSVAMRYNHTKSWTYRELRAAVNRLAAGLADLGVRRGDRVFVTLPNCPEYVFAFFAIQKLGAVIVNAGPLMGADDLRSLIAMTSPRAVIGLDLQAPVIGRACKGSTVERYVWVTLQHYQTVFKRLGYQFKLWHEQEEAMDEKRHSTLAHLMEHSAAKPPTVEPDPNDTAVLQPTGGTTGTLKVAQLSHRNLLANAMQICVWMSNRFGQERMLAALPMFHVYGLTTCLITGVYSGAQMIVLTRFNAGQTMEALRTHRPTVFPLVPAICEAISNEMEREVEDEHTPPRKLEGLRLCISGAAPLPQAIAERFERLTGAVVIEGYGLSEASPVTHVNFPGHPRHGSIGLPMPDTRVRVVDVETGGRDVLPGEAGEMLICGPQIMSGYFANPEQSARVLTTDEHGDTWLHTGDIVRCDEDGYFYVLDRKKDMIIRSGLKVYPAKVEKVLMAHKNVADVGVVGRADAVHTEIVTAIVVLKEAVENQSGLTDELRGLCREHLAPYEVPAKFEYVERLPRSPLGKLLRKDLRDATPAELVPPTSPEQSNGNGKHNGNGNGRNGKRVA